MATTPPETPPEPMQPAQPSIPPAEAPAMPGDVDVPSPAAPEPGQA